VSGGAVGSMIAACGGDSAVERWAKAICEFEAECDEEYFDEDYDSVADCVQQISAEAQEDLDELRAEESAKCVSAVVDYYDCIIASYDTNACTYDEYACESEGEEVYDECDAGSGFRVRAQRQARRIAAR
jgi:hypothetical protein